MNKTRDPLLYLAPIQGITTCIYRNVYSRCFSGFDAAVTPFVRSCTVTGADSRALRDLFPVRNRAGFLLIPQILSNSPQEFIAAARALFDLGYEQVNWNLGCPHQRVRNKRRGAGLLCFPRRIVEFLEQVLPNIPNRFSVKMRLGNENPRDIFSLLPLLNVFPIQQIILHPRYGSQMYTGQADVGAFAECLQLSRHPVMYNGDIVSAAAFATLSDRLPAVSGWMLGRGAISNPFLAEQIKGGAAGSAPDRRERFIRFHDELFAAYSQELSGSGHLIDKMKALWSYWAGAFRNGPEVFKRIRRVRSADGYTTIVKRFFSGAMEMLI